MSKQGTLKLTEGGRPKCIEKTSSPEPGERTPGSVTWLKGVKNARSCEAKPGCNVATTRRVIARNGTPIPVCEHCGQRVDVQDASVQAMPNLVARVVNGARASSMYQFDVVMGSL